MDGGSCFSLLEAWNQDLGLYPIHSVSPYVSSDVCKVQAVTENLEWFPQNKYSKYMEPLELILQKDMEIFGLPVKHLDPKLVDVAI